MSIEVQEFLASLKSDQTRDLYSHVLKRVLVSPESFLKQAATERRAAEMFLLHHIEERRKTIRAYTILTQMAVVKSFLEFNEIELNWRKIKKAIPSRRYVAADRAPTTKEIRAALKTADEREQAAALMMATGGFRLGAWEPMNLQHIQFRESGLALVTIYPGDIEEYRCFITPEAVSALRTYLSARERSGEKLSPSSPVLRDKWNYSLKDGKIRHMITSDIPYRMHTAGIQAFIRRIWERTGTKAPDFKSSHGFRKFFKTQAQRAMKWEDVELLMGHKLPYYKATLEHLEEEYIKAIPYLTISESEEAKQELQLVKKQDEDRWTKIRLENLELKNTVGEMKQDMVKIIETVNRVERLRSMGIEGDKV